MRGPSRCSLPRFKIIHGRVGTHPMVIGVSSRMPWRTNFHKLCSSSGDKTPLVKPGFTLPQEFSKIWKNLFVLLTGSLWETAILNLNPHGRCSDNFAIKPWIPPLCYFPCGLWIRTITPPSKFFPFSDLFHQTEKLILKFQDKAWHLFQTWVRRMNLTSNLNMVQAQILTAFEYKRLRTWTNIFFTGQEKPFTMETTWEEDESENPFTLKI